MARILIVDNDDRYRHACALDLRNEGHDVVTAASGFDALRSIDSAAPELVITEVQLPGMDGLDLMGRLLERDRGLIVILNSASCRYKDNFMSWAADACCQKSEDGRELRATVRRLLGRKSPLVSHCHWRNELAPHLGEENRRAS